MEYPGFTLGPLSLRVEAGEYLVLLGPSGAGKTTLLEWIAGFRAGTGGRLRIDGRDLTDAPPRQRDLGIVYQDAALFPHLSVAENLAFPLRMRGWSASEARRRTTELAGLLRVEHRLHADPRSLSAGEARRVALGRALAAGQRVLLLDEPLDGLDPGLRRDLRHELALLHRRLDLTVLHITHELQEARSLGSRLAVLIDGRLVQTGSPAQLFSRPADARVARLLMTRNFVAGVGDPGRGGIRVSEGIVLPAPVRRAGPVQGRVHGLGLHDGATPEGGVRGYLRGIEPAADGTVRAVVELAGTTEGPPLQLEVEVDDPRRMRQLDPGQEVGLDFRGARWEIY